MDAVVIEDSATSAFWQTLAHAFLPPMAAEVAHAFVEDLHHDLQELSEAMELDASDALEVFRSQVQAFKQPQSLLVEYASIFLPPAGQVTLNLSRYVDGGAGLCMDAIEAAYFAQGVQAASNLHDLPDHAARQFEFMAYLAAKEPGAERDFSRQCLEGALPIFVRQLAERHPTSPYTALARIAALAVRTADATDAVATPQRANRRHDLSVGVWRLCCDCKRPYAREKEISIMTLALQNAGLPAEHLSQCQECRDRAQGFFTREVA